MAKGEAQPTGYVGLTFDDGPHPSTTMPLLEALRAHGAPATFFIWGEHAEAHPDLLRAEVSAGMWIANHTYTHPRLSRLGEPAVVDEIASTQRTIRRITGLTPTLFRPPYGDTNTGIRAGAARLGLTEVLWSVDTLDWAGASTAEIVAAAATVRPGGIILMHDLGYQTTVDAVPQILRDLADRGLRPGRITAGHPVIVAP
jgi:peptidoglycan/xylan/chitin deacetylase (PgdA/CDA1 family)